MKTYLRHFSDAYESILTPTEFPRKCRQINEKFKAAEYRTIGLIAFVLFGNLFARGNGKVLKLRFLWLLQVDCQVVG